MPIEDSPQHRRGADRHRRHADRAWPPAGQGLLRAGAAEAGRLHRRTHHRPAGRLVRSHCTAMAGRWRGRRERRFLFPPRRRQPASSPAISPKASAKGRTMPPGSTKSAVRFWPKFREPPSPPTRPFRMADLAIDFCEDVPPLPRSEVLKIVAIFERFGATAKISSIHVNGWFGGYDKLSTTRRFLADCFGLDIERDRIARRLRGRQPQRFADVRLLPKQRRRSECARLQG